MYRYYLRPPTSSSKVATPSTYVTDEYFQLVNDYDDDGCKHASDGDDDSVDDFSVVGQPFQQDAGRTHGGGESIDTMMEKQKEKKKKEENVTSSTTSAINNTSTPSSNSRNITNPYERYLWDGGPLERAITMDLCKLRKAWKQQRLRQEHSRNTYYNESATATHHKLLNHYTNTKRPAISLGQSFQQFKNIFQQFNFGILHYLIPKGKCDVIKYTQIIFSACFNLLKQSFSASCASSYLYKSDGVGHDGQYDDQHQVLVKASFALFALYTLHQSCPLLPYYSLPLSSSSKDDGDDEDNTRVKKKDIFKMMIPLGVNHYVQMPAVISTAGQRQSLLSRRIRGIYRPPIRIDQLHYSLLQRLRDLSLLLLDQCEKHYYETGEQQQQQQHKNNSNQHHQKRVNTNTAENGHAGELVEEQTASPPPFHCSCSIAMDVIHIIDKMQMDPNDCTFELCEYIGPGSLEGLAGCSMFYNSHPWPSSSSTTNTNMASAHMSEIIDTIDSVTTKNIESDLALDNLDEAFSTYSESIKAISFKPCAISEKRGMSHQSALVQNTIISLRRGKSIEEKWYWVRQKMKKVCEMFAEKQNGDEIGTRNKQKQLMRIFFPKEEELIDDAKEIVPADCAIPTRRVAIGDTAKALEIRFSKDLAGVIQLPQNQMTAENTAEDKRFSQSFSSENAVGKKHENVDHFPNDHCCGQSSISAHDNSTFHTYNVILPQSMSKSLQLGIKRIFTGREWEKLISVYKSGKKSKFDEKGDGDDDSVAFYDSCLRVDGEDEDVYDDTEITTTEWENVENSAGETDEYSVATELGRATIDILLSAVNDKPIPHSREEDNSLDGGMSSSVGDSLDYGDEHMSHSDEHESLLEEGQAMLNHLLCTVMQSGSRRRKLTSSSSNERKSKRAKRPKISQYYASTTGTSASETKRRPLSTEKDNLGGDHESVSVLSGVGRATLDSLLSKALNINPRRVSKKKIVDGGGSGKFLHAATHDSEGIIWDEWPTSSAEPSTFSVKEDKKISVAPQAVDRADPNFLLSRADEQDSVKIAIPSLKRKRKVAKSPTQELDKSSLRRVTKANELDDSSVTSNAGRDTLASLLAKAKSTSGVTDAQN